MILSNATAAHSAAHIYTKGRFRISHQSNRNQPNHSFLPVTGFSFQLRTMTLDVAAPASLAQVGQHPQQSFQHPQHPKHPQPHNVHKI